MNCKTRRAIIALCVGFLFVVAVAATQQGFFWLAGSCTVVLLGVALGVSDETLFGEKED